MFSLGSVVVLVLIVRGIGGVRDLSTVLVMGPSLRKWRIWGRTSVILYVLNRIRNLRNGNV